MKALRSSLLDRVSGIEHGFGTRENPLPVTQPEQFEEVRPRWKQVHGNRVDLVTEPGQEMGELDGLMTRTSDLPIAVVTADCVPILLARKDGRAVAALHAGWKGTIARIVENWASLVEESGNPPSDWVAAIGPAIGGMHYEVSEELVERFAEEFSEVWDQGFNPLPRHLDLKAINYQLLLDVGVEQIEILPHSTHSEEFYSYRRGDRKSRQYSLIQIKN